MIQHIYKAKRRALETDEERVKCRVSDTGCKAKRSALETDEERVKHRVSDNTCKNFVVREYACSKFSSMGKDGSEKVEIGDIGETKEVREVFENNATGAYQT